MISTKYVNFKEKEKTIEILQSESQQSRRIYLYCAARVFKGTFYRCVMGGGGTLDHLGPIRNTI